MTTPTTTWGLHPDLTADGLFRSVLEHPFDTTVRLILADRLDEVREAERAEFIRLQCELESDSVGRGLYCRRETELFTGIFGDPPVANGLQLTNSVPWFDSEWEVDFPSDTPIGLVRNGFIQEVRCPLAWWLGGPCDWCDGLGSNDTALWCGGCHGTGTTPGHGAAVVSWHPVTRVVVADRWPAGPFNAGERCSWVNWSPTGNDPADLPGDVFDLLTGPEVMVAEMRVKSFPTREAAVEALSRALVDLARERAGLPAITWEVSQ